ncbi:hypothetical protein MCOR27_006464 [Pyricularia oryzae]|uniref:Uncharacterized protein n=1 Tax=Pyricularia grisea TaxID=148305 RepID=A0ABQ8N3G9_PYRGI|nr:hypothetical protein MCOR01_002980 [Pyricularia oryzae]KAI6290618.1 hypothetical protein MCOR33_011177 [Pyricularia grisea]KAI6252555.1 hypothetical protein MCOR19_010842 [Pyricularia oryzae]KAI6276471.1 hypothetical protein MCOR27_006464 [Pyricularia oryzae]KAI6288481.1 hypothetical protein MCOR26_000083 [Pyricularia oryzae]
MRWALGPTSFWFKPSWFKDVAAMNFDGCFFPMRRKVSPDAPLKLLDNSESSLKAEKRDHLCVFGKFNTEVLNQCVCFLLMSKGDRWTNAMKYRNKSDWLMEVTGSDS